MDRAFELFQVVPAAFLEMVQGVDFVSLGF